MTLKQRAVLFDDDDWKKVKEMASELRVSAGEFVRSTVQEKLYMQKVGTPVLEDVAEYAEEVLVRCSECKRQAVKVEPDGVHGRCTVCGETATVEF